MVNENYKIIMQPIAIVGMSCRFGGEVTNIESFWKVISDGIDVSSEVPIERWNKDDYYDPIPGKIGKMYTKRGSFIKGVDLFDPLFFGISGREAQFMDPNQRLLLEVSYEAIENSGLTLKECQQLRTSVFVGCMNYDYSQIVAEANNVDLHANTGTSPSVLSGRIAHALGFTGPVLTLDTACSSSLLCAHLASNSLRSREADIAIVGGVNLQLTPFTTVMECAGNMLSKDGRCKAFTNNADGFGRGDGCGVIVMMRLADAQAAGLPVLACIYGSAVNHDGSSGAMTVPSAKAQEQVIREALMRALVEAKDIDYIECHGTGTSLGDPIEVDALNQAFKTRTSPLLIGSVKNNIGHTEAAAGIASLIKSVLMLQYKTLPPLCNFESLSNKINWQNSIAQVNKTLSPWNNKKRYIGVSSFGLSGTNVHMILGEAPDEELKMPAMKLPLFLSAKSQYSLKENATRLCEFLITIPDEMYSAVAYTLAVGKTHYQYRLIIHASNRSDAILKLKSIAHTDIIKSPVICSESVIELSIDTSDFRSDDKIYFLKPYQLIFNKNKKLFTERNMLPFLNTYAKIAILTSLNIFPDIFVASDEALLIALAINESLPFEEILSIREVVLQRNKDMLCNILNNITIKKPKASIINKNSGAVFESDKVEDLVQLFFSEKSESSNIEFLNTIDFKIKLPTSFEELLEQIEKCYKAGMEIDFNNLFDQHYSRLALPNYRFEKTRYWVSVNNDSRWGFTKNILKHNKTETKPTLFIEQPNGNIIYQIALDAEGDHYWKYHKLDNILCIPGVMNIQAALDFKEFYFPESALEIIQLTFHKMVFMDSLYQAKFQATFTLEKDGYWHYQSFVFNPEDMEWQKVATAKISLIASVEHHSLKISLTEINRTWKKTVSGHSLYNGHEKLGYHLGKPFQWLGDGFYADSETIRYISHPTSILEDEKLYKIYPGLIDSCMQCYDSNGIESAMKVEEGKIYVPFHIKKITFESKFDTNKSALAYARMNNKKEDFNNSSIGDIALYQENNAVFYMKGIEYRKYSTILPKTNYPFYHLAWKQTEHTLKPDNPISDRIVLSLTAEDTEQSDEFLHAKFSSEITSDKIHHIVITMDSGAALSALSQALRAFIQWLYTFYDNRKDLLVSIITISAIKISPVDEVDPIQTQLWGMARAIRHEKADLNLQLLDISDKKFLTNFQKTIGHLPEWQVAIRESKLYVPRIREFSTPNAKSFICDSEKCYLVLGGTGGLGLSVTKHLIERGAKHIALISRTGKISDEKLLDIIEKMGVKPLVIAADVCNFNLLADAIKKIEISNQIGGVIFAVGFLEDGILEKQTYDKFDNVLRGKLYGLNNIWNILQGRQLDFFVVFSSLSSAFGTYGQTSYAAANAYLDGFCQNISAPYPVVSIAWGPWSQVGMAANKSNILSPYFANTGIEWITPEEAYTFFDLAITSDMRTLIAARLDWAKMLSVSSQSDATTWLSEMSGAEDKQYTSEKNESGEKNIINIVANIMNIPESQIDPSIKLNVMGLDSVMALEISSKIKEVFNLDIPLVSLLENASVGWLSEQVSLAKTEASEFSEIMDQCTKIISEIMKLSAEHIDIEQKLNIMGLDSIMALEISNAIKEKYSVDIPLVSLLENATIKWISNLIQEHRDAVKGDEHKVVEVSI